MMQDLSVREMNFHTTWWYARDLFLTSKIMVYLFHVDLVNVTTITSLFWSHKVMICLMEHLCSQTVGEWTIYPWIHNNYNSLSEVISFVLFQYRICIQAGIYIGFFNKRKVISRKRLQKGTIIIARDVYKIIHVSSSNNLSFWVDGS